MFLFAHSDGVQEARLCFIFFSEGCHRMYAFAESHKLFLDSKSIKGERGKINLRISGSIFRNTYCMYNACTCDRGREISSVLNYCKENKIKSYLTEWNEVIFWFIIIFLALLTINSLFYLDNCDKQLSQLMWNFKF